MRARFNPSGVGNPEILQGGDALKVDREYVVLEVFAPIERSPEFRIEFIEGEGSALFDSRAFTVTSSLLPPSWRYVQFATGSFSLRPEPWGRPGFWDAYYDGDPQAREIFEVEKRRILSDS
ncbi:hypothetical protein [Streptomyces sp. AC512_CC834]|uniref:hypothetical protein n=1 Tax=Streptomyces sp. AC512_CC834 TaxID=2823691 RepID=UPI001C272001|nr:hypothetical protein [Streptomyces sp. AC512_CC834]